MSLNKKDLNMLEELNFKGKISLLELSKKYEVSERNIRYNIENLNFYLSKASLAEIILKKGEVSWKGSKDELINFIKNIDSDNYIFSREEREKFILITYLFSSNTKITNIEKYLKVSRPTIKKDILSLNEYLKKFELEFIREDNFLYIGGKEKKLRHLKLLNLLEFIEIKNGTINFIPKFYITERVESNLIKEYLQDIDTSLFFPIILKIEKQLNVTFEENFKNLMYIYLIPTIERIKKGNIILKKNNSEFLKTLTDYRIIKKILEEIIPKEFEFEFLHLTEYFISGYYSHNFSENLSLVEKFIENFSKDLSSSLNFDFYNLLDYREEILKYLLPAVYRIKNNFFLIKNKKIPLLNENVYKAVKAAVLSSNFIMKEPFQEDEIIFLTQISEKYIKLEKEKKISLSKLLDIIKNNSNSINEENLIQELLINFKDKIENDKNNH